MDQDIDGQRKNGPARRAATQEPEADATIGAAERKKEYFSVRLTFSGTSQEFEDPRLAGEAFFRADPAERPLVTHVDGNTARTMARTELHGTHEGGETRYFKSLPDSHAPDAEFRVGFLAAMEVSISERLERVQVGRTGETVVDRLDAGLKDDLEAFARREPEKAASLWSDRTEEPAPGPILQAAAKAREGMVEAKAQVNQVVTAEKPQVVATGDWVTTDQNVELRPVAVAIDRGLHAGFEAKLPGGETEISFSERTFATSRDALRHAWDFYEGGEEGLEIAVSRAAAIERETGDDTDRVPSGLVREHREQPEFPRPETAIYAGEEAQLVLTLGRDTEAKGVGYVIPNTLLFNGSIVVLDVKGEIFEATSRHRQAEGDAVYRFSPFDFDHPTHRYNPLERVARIEHPEQRYTELAKISDYFLTVSDKGTAGDFLTEGRELFVAAGLLAIERGKPTIGEISRILFGRGATQEVYGEHAEEVKHPNAAQTFRKFAGYSDRTLSSHASVLGGAGMTLWNNPAVDRATSGNDFSFTELRKRPMSIYVVVNADDIRTLSPLVRLFFGELIATMRSTLPDLRTEPWPVMVMLDEFDQLGPMPIVEQALKQLAGHGARVSIITQSIPGLDNIYGENVRMSLESAAGMKLYLAANDKKTAGEISDALGKTTKLSVSDSVSRDRDFMQRRSVSRRMEERPLLSPDEVRRLNPDQAILIPERQNPLLVHRIVYFQDPTFKTLFEAQSGPLPFPSKEGATLRALAARVEELERQTAQKQVVDFVRPTNAEAAAVALPEPGLATEIASAENAQTEFWLQRPAVGATGAKEGDPGKLEASPLPALGTLRPDQTVAVARMNRFTQKVQALGV